MLTSETSPSVSLGFCVFLMGGGCGYGDRGGLGPALRQRFLLVSCVLGAWIERIHSDLSQDRTHRAGHRSESLTEEQERVGQHWHRQWPEYLGRVPGIESSLR